MQPASESSPPAHPENVARIRALSWRKRAPRYALGQLVREPHGQVGAVDCIFADLEAVEQSSIILDVGRWYEKLSIRPKTLKSGIWYSVVLPGGACVVGEDDLTEAGA